MPTARIGPDIVSKQQALTGFDVSPDGETIVFARREVRDGTYVAHLWRVPTVGGRPERLTSTKAVDGAPRISPDGSSVLFVSDREGSKKPQPWVLPMGGGEARRLSELKDGVSSGAWSPDGRTIALTAASGVERYLIGERAQDKDPTGRVIRDVLWRYDGIGVLDQHDAVWTVPSGGGAPVRRTSPEHGAGGVIVVAGREAHRLRRRPPPRADDRGPPAGVDDPGRRREPVAREPGRARRDRSRLGAARHRLARVAGTGTGLADHRRVGAPRP